MAVSRGWGRQCGDAISSKRWAPARGQGDGGSGRGAPGGRGGGGAPASPRVGLAGCVVGTGAGVVHGLAGLANAQQNCWPMILFGGASETYRGGMGAFQEERQVLIASPFCKFAHGIESVQRIPYYVEMATRNAIYGRPGATYLDMPDDMIRGTCELDKVAQVERVPEAPRMVAPMENVEAALNLLERAPRPLLLLVEG